MNFKSNPSSEYKVADLPRDIREEMLNLHAIFVNPDSTEKSFFDKTAPVKYLRTSSEYTLDPVPEEHLQGIKEADNLLSSCYS